MRRREFLRLAGATLTALAATFGREAHAQEPRSVVFNGAGGSWQDSAREAWLAPFAKQAGVRVIDVFPFDLGKLSTMVQTGTVAWDVTDIPIAQLGVAIAHNLLEPIDYSIVDKTVLPAEDYGTYHVAYAHFSSNIVYNRSRIAGSSKPTTWADYWDLRKFPGPRCFRRDPEIALEAALLADGVPPQSLYPLDVDRAFRKLDQIKSQVRWWTSAAQSVQMIVDGEVTLGVTFNSRAIAAREKGIPLEVVWNQGLLTDTVFVVPRGAKNKGDAMRLINYIIRAEPQARFANVNKTAPANPKAVPLINPAVLKDLVSAPENRRGMVRLDELGFWAKNHDQLQKRFDMWLLTS